MKKFLNLALLTIASILLVSSVHAQETGEKRYITPPDYAENVYFGDAHVHTSMSMDAAAWGASQSPEGAYRYARGEEVTSFKGLPTAMPAAKKSPLSRVGKRN